MKENIALKKYFINVKIIDKKNINSEILKYSILNTYRNNIIPSLKLIKFNEIDYIIHFKEYFGFFDFVNENKINIEKIKMVEDDFLRRNYSLLDLYKNNFISFENEDVLKYLKKFNKKFNKIEDITKFNIMSKI